MRCAFRHVVGFDDAPFTRGGAAEVLLIGAIFSGLRLDGVVSGRIRQDGDDATAAIERLVAGSRFAPQLQLVLLQGSTVAGFNVIDLGHLHRQLALPLLAVVRRGPDPAAVRAALAKVPGGTEKWRRIERNGPMEPLAGLHVQRVGLSPAAAVEVIRCYAVHSRVPEPLRTAHLIGAGLTTQSRQRV